VQLDVVGATQPVVLQGYSRFFVAKTSKCGVYIEGKSGAFGMKMGACLGAALGD
jgi:polyisoprenoid-binding protein YceI